MSTISIRDERLTGATMLPDDFIDYYMPRANGEYVKIYLYLLRSAHSHVSVPTISALADTFHLTERDINRALSYWQEAGILNLVMKGEELDSIVFLPVSQKLHETQNDPAKEEPSSAVAVQEKPLSQISSSRLKELRASEQAKSDVKNIIFITQQYLGRPLNATDIRRILYLYDELHMSVDLIDYLVEYCVGRDKTGMNYIMTVGLAWHDEGIRTVKEAKTRNNQSMKNYYTIFKYFGITGRSPVPSEINDMDRWLYEYRFPMTIIEEAAARTVKKTGKPSFPYAERILSDWHKAGIRRTTDIAALDEKHKTYQKDAGKDSVQKDSSAGKFGNFPQRDDVEHRKLVEAVIQNQ